MSQRLVMTLVCLAVASTAAARDRWVSLGQVDLDPRDDRVEIQLRGDARVDALVLGVDNSAARIRGVKARLGNGAVLDWPVRGEMYPGQRTSAFDLPGDVERHVASVVVFYETGLRRADRDGRRHGDWDKAWDRDQDRPQDREWDRNWERDYGRYRPTLTVWGLDVERWSSLGQVPLDPRGDRAVIDLRASTPLDALVLGVDSASVRVRGVRVRLGDGTLLDWPVRGEMYPGQRTNVFELPGQAERQVTKVVVFYETGLRRANWRRYGDWDRAWDRDPDRPADRDWDRGWKRAYGEVKPVLTIWGRD